jgi:hypothetical protein
MNGLLSSSPPNGAMRRFRSASLSRERTAERNIIGSLLVKEFSPRGGGRGGGGVPKKMWSSATLEYSMENIPACTNQIAPDVKQQLK